MSGDDVRVCADDVIAAGARKLGADASLWSQVPDLDCPIVTGADHFVVVAHELGGEHLPTVTCERVSQPLIVKSPNAAASKKNIFFPSNISSQLSFLSLTNVYVIT